MRSFSIAFITALGALSLAISACQPADNDDSQLAGTGATGGTGLPGTGGTMAGTPASGAGGLGGAAGAAGTPASGGVGGGGTGGSAGTVSTGGSAGAAGAMEDSGVTDPALAMCVSDVMTSTPSTVAACATCMCTSCGPQLLAVDGDDDANAMLRCIAMNNCSGSCCLCNGPDCNANGAAMFGAGPCGNEIQTAAGVVPMMGGLGAIANGATLVANCAPTGPADQSCGDAARLGECISTSCAAECPMAECL